MNLKDYLEFSKGIFRDSLGSKSLYLCNQDAKSAYHNVNSIINHISTSYIFNGTNISFMIELSINKAVTLLS